MKIRTALTLKNTCTTAVVFLLCMVSIYLLSERARSDTFFHDLKQEGITKAHLFLQNRVDARTMQDIYLNNAKFINEVEVAVYTTDFRMLYHDAVQNDIVKESREMVDEILRKREIKFYVGDYQAIGMLYTFRGTDYVVTAAAYDGYGYANQSRLGHTLFVLLVIGVSLLAIVGWLLARAALHPIRNIVKKAETITASEISYRLPVNDDKDELGELSLTFNALLDRLEVSFRSQKTFVSNVSHELRTPLAAFIAELDLSLQKERTGEQYRAAIGAALQDARRMSKLIDGLLNLAKADYLKEQIKMEEIRMDELLLDVREYILRAHPDYRIHLIFEQGEAEDDCLITVRGNLHLLSIAFSNLIENNCKYSSDHTSFIQISYWDKWAVLRFSDCGAGMSDEDKQNLFTLFYRGSRDRMVEGHGIGMALSQKIIRIHQGEITVNSELGKGTTFVVELPHV